MKWNEFIKMAKANGYELHRHGKKHDIYIKKETKELLVVERHSNQEIRPGLLAKLKKQIGVSN